MLPAPAMRAAGSDPLSTPTSVQEASTPSRSFQDPGTVRGDDRRLPLSGGASLPGPQVASLLSTATCHMAPACTHVNSPGPINSRWRGSKGEGVGWFPPISLPDSEPGRHGGT